jgi:hypothetical protein
LPKSSSAANEAGWRNAKHRQKWRYTHATYAYPLLGDLPAAEIDTRKRSPSSRIARQRRLLRRQPIEYAGPSLDHLIAKPPVVP